MSAVFGVPAHEAWVLNRITSTAAVSFLAWDICITLDDEVNYIWPKPNASLIKWLYLYNRYFSLIAQIALRFLYLLAFDWYATPDICYVIWIGEAFASQSMTISTDMILMLRVYALYNQRLWCGMLLFALLVLGNIVQAVSMAKAIPLLPFQPLCLVTKIPRPVVYSGAATIFIQLVIVGLTLAKQVFAARSGWERTPVVSLMLRDGSFAFAIISGILISAVVIIIMENAIGMHLIWWFLSILLTAGSRLIIRMQRLAMPAQQDSDIMTTELYEMEDPVVRCTTT